LRFVLFASSFFYTIFTFPARSSPLSPPLRSRSFSPSEPFPPCAHRPPTFGTCCTFFTFLCRISYLYTSRFRLFFDFITPPPDVPITFPLITRGDAVWPSNLFHRGSRVCTCRCRCDLGSTMLPRESTTCDDCAPFKFSESCDPYTVFPSFFFFFPTPLTLLPTQALHPVKLQVFAVSVTSSLLQSSFARPDYHVKPFHTPPSVRFHM
jgi:hypothetical protein